MEPKEAHKYAKWCNDNGTIIYPVPLYDKGNSYHIAVERNKEASVGTMVFQSETKGNEKNVWEQIRFIYKLIYEKNHP